MKSKLLALVVTLTSVLPLHGDSSARTILYHSKDIVNIRAKLKYTTLIQLPTTEKIIEAATGDKEFWIIDVVGSICFLHPAKKDIRSNLNLITDKGNIYSFTLEDVTDQPGDPDLKVIVQPSDQSSIVGSSGPPQYVPAAQVTAMENELQGLESHVTQVVDEYKASYPTEMKFDYRFAAGKAPFNVTAIYHDGNFTYIKSDASEKFAVYEVRDGSPNMVNYELRNGTYIIAKVVDKGYFEVGKKKMGFIRKVRP